MRFFCGDWGSLEDTLPVGSRASYDLILTAETIYSLDAIPRLARCIVSLLRPQSGMAIVAAKRYYFGVGGGFLAFNKALRDEAHRSGMQVRAEEPVVIEDGRSNVREILAFSLQSRSSSDPSEPQGLLT